MKGMSAVFERLKSGKRVVRMILLAAVGVCMILIGGQIGHERQNSPETPNADSYGAARSYTEELEKRIASLCEKIDGVTQAHVLLSLDGSAEQVYAENTSGTSVDYVIIEGKDGDTAVLVQEIYPQIRGVAVVCTRGNDSEIQRTVTELLAAALGISSSRIRVAGT